MTDRTGRPAGDALTGAELDAIEKFRVYGPSRPVEASVGSTYGIMPSRLARALADLAARMVTLDDDRLPTDTQLFVSIDLGVWPAALGAPDSDKMRTVDLVLAALLPNIRPSRRLMSDGTVHYGAAGMTAAGLAVAVSNSVTPTDEEAAEHERRVFDRAATAAGHERRMVHAGGSDAGELVVVDCTCGGFTSGTVSETRALGAWREHAAAVMGAAS